MRSFLIPSPSKIISVIDTNLKFQVLAKKVQEAPYLVLTSIFLLGNKAVYTKNNL